MRAQTLAARLRPARERPHANPVRDARTRIRYAGAPRPAKRSQIVAGTLTAILRRPSRMRPLTVPTGVSSIVAISECE